VKNWVFFFLCCPSLSFSSVLITAFWHWDHSLSSLANTATQPVWSADQTHCTSQGHDTELSHYYSIREITNTHTHTHTLSFWIREESLKSCTQEAKEVLNSFLLIFFVMTVITDGTILNHGEELYSIIWFRYTISLTICSVLYINNGWGHEWGQVGQAALSQ